MDVEQAEDRLATGAIAAVGALLVMLLVAAGVGVAYLLDASARAQRPRGVFAERALPPPGERGQIRQETFGQESAAQRQRARDSAILRSYGWVDRERGIARIPIERAIDLYVAEANAR